MDRKFIENAILFDGTKEYDLKEIIEHQDFKRIYAMANVQYSQFIEDINSVNACLYIDATNRPTYRIIGAPNDLLDKLRSANLG